MHKIMFTALILALIGAAHATSTPEASPEASAPASAPPISAANMSLSPLEQLKAWTELISQGSNDYYATSIPSISGAKSVLKWKQLRPMLEAHCKLPFYLSGEQAKVEGIQNVNPEIIYCISDNIQALSDNVVFSDIFEVLYTHYLRERIRHYHWQSEYWLISNSAFLGREVTAESELDKLLTYLRATNTIAGSFWQRRREDGSAPALVTLLDTLIERYDPYYHRDFVEYRKLEEVQRLRQHGCHLMGSEKRLLSCVVVDYYKNQAFVEQCRPEHGARTRKNVVSPSELVVKCRHFIDALRGYSELSEVLALLANTVRFADKKAYREGIALLKDMVGWTRLYSTAGYMQQQDGILVLTDALAQESFKQEFIETTYADYNLYKNIVTNLMRKESSDYNTPSYYMLLGQEAYKLVMGLDYRRVVRGDHEADYLYRELNKSGVLTLAQKVALKARLLQTLRFVAASRAVVREQPNAAAEEQDKLQIWRAVQLIASEGEWSHISYTDSSYYPEENKNGWVYTPLLSSEKLSAEQLMGNYRAAVNAKDKRQWLERAAATSPRDRNILRELAKFLETVGDIESARKVLDNM